MTDRNPRTTRPSARRGLAFGLVLLACNSARAESPRAISWRTEYSQARAEAQARNLPLWIQFTGPWCYYCHRMEREAFVHPEVVSATKDRVVPVKLRSDANEALALHFGFSALPATVILRPTGEVIAAQEGYLDTGRFRSFLEQSLAQRRPAERAQPPSGSAAVGRGPQAPVPASSIDPVALAGYCPVTLVRNHRLTMGQAGLAVRYEGLEYRFASPELRDTFLREPESFLPANGGACLVSHVDRGQAVAGDPRYGVLYRGRLYLCADESARDRFLRFPERYSSAEVADQGFCPHCRFHTGLLVRGQPEFSATHAGRRYYFPDAQHLEAFRADPGKYVR